jgi:hypothetical protein
MNLHQHELPVYYEFISIIIKSIGNALSVDDSVDHINVLNKG